MNAAIHKATFDYLNKLSRNNNRDWFNLNKDEYLRAQENVEQFVNGLISKMNTHDRLETPSGKKSLYRIYNDVRFAKDKSPYSPRFAGYLKREKPLLRGGYYYWIRPGGSRVACGFAYPNPDDLRSIRNDIADNFKDWNKLLNSKEVKSSFGVMTGEQVKSAPRGFAIDHPAIGLLRFKQYWFERSFSDREVLSADFLLTVNKTFKSIRPVFNYMSDLLTTNANGESLY